MRLRQGVGGRLAVVAFWIGLGLAQGALAQETKEQQNAAGVGGGQATVSSISGGIQIGASGGSGSSGSSTGSRSGLAAQVGKGALILSPAQSALEQASGDLQHGRLARAIQLGERAAGKSTSPFEKAEALGLLVEAQRQRWEKEGRDGAGRERLVERIAQAVKVQELAQGPIPPQSLPGDSVVRSETDRNPTRRSEHYSKRALLVCEDLVSMDDPFFIQCLARHSRILLGERDFENAEGAYARLVSISRGLIGPQLVELARAFRGLGSAQLGRLNFAGARKSFEQSLEIHERLLGDGSETATSLNDLATALGGAGEFRRAQQLYERAIAIWEKGGAADRRHLVAGLDNLAHTLWKLGDYARARPLYERALTLAEKDLSADAGFMAQSLTRYARLLQSAGQLGKARTFFERARSLAEAARDDLLLGVISNDLGRLFVATGDPERARRSYERALRIFQERLGPEHPNVALTLADMGAAADPRSARRHYEKALELSEKVLGLDHPAVALMLLDLGRVTLQGGDGPAARDYYERALAVLENKVGKEHPGVARTLDHLAAVLATQGYRRSAIALGERALGIQERVLGADHPDLAVTLYLIADNRLRVGDHREALDAALRAEVIAGQHVSLTARTLAESEALRYASSRASARDMMLSLVSRRASSDRRKNVWDAVIRSRAVVLDEIASRRRFGGDGGAPQLRKATSEFTSESRRLANLIVRGPEGTTAEGYQRLLADARDARDTAQRLLAATAEPFRRDQAQRRAGLGDVAAALPDGSALVAYVRYDQYLLPEGGAPAAESALSATPSYMAFVLRAGDPEISVAPLGEAAAIESQIAAWRREMAPASSPEQSEAQYRALAQQIRQHVWDPVGAKLQGVERVFVVPDGPLHLLNFAALPLHEDGRYLADSGPLFHYLSAERDLVRPVRAREPGRGILVVGGPSFDDGAAFSARRDERRQPEVAEESALDDEGAALSKAATTRGPGACDPFSTLRFEPLPGAAREAAGIASLWAHVGEGGEARTGDVTLLVGPEARESAFKAAAPSRKVLHLATHGFFVPGPCSAPVARMRGLGGLVIEAPAPTPERVDRPLLSGLAMAGANHRRDASGSEEDGILTAEEIAALDLSGVEWTVLSACDTGVGEVRAGEGVFGLRRAFELAGTGSLIMSLWSVGDKLAEQWMLALYEGRLRRGMGTGEAVRSATLQLLDARRKAGQPTHPYYWAAFVATGDWR